MAPITAACQDLIARHGIAGALLFLYPFERPTCSSLLDEMGAVTRSDEEAVVLQLLAQLQTAGCQFEGLGYDDRHMMLKSADASGHMRVLRRLIAMALAHPDRHWDWGWVSRSPAITVSDVLAHPDWPWDWHELNHNPNIPWDWGWVKRNPDGTVTATFFTFVTV